MNRFGHFVPRPDDIPEVDHTQPLPILGRVDLPQSSISVDNQKLILLSVELAELKTQLVQLQDLITSVKEGRAEDYTKLKNTILAIEKLCKEDISINYQTIVNNFEDHKKTTGENILQLETRLQQKIEIGERAFVSTVGRLGTTLNNMQHDISVLSSINLESLVSSYITRLLDQFKNYVKNLLTFGRK